MSQPCGRCWGGAVTVGVVALAVAVLMVGTAGAGSADGAGRAASAGNPHGRPAHTVTFDRYSLMVDGRRTFIWSGEFHAFRLPSPDLWRDVLEKMKAEGYNAVSIYFDWGYHSPKSGVYDFGGVRDMDRLLDIAAQVGLYVIARPGPYINGEVTAGGFPGWLTTQAGRARTDAPDYLAAVDQWMTAIDAIIARHQLTNGTGTVILYQVENELASTGAAQHAYLQHLYDKVRADGITVPIFHNDKGRNGFWVPSKLRRPRHGARAARPVRLRRLPGRHVPHRRHPGRAVDRARLGHLGPRAARRAAPARRPTRRASRPSSAAAGSTTGAASAPTRAPRSARGRATSASSTRRTSPTA